MPYHRLWRSQRHVDGVALCRMFDRAMRGQSLAKCLSSDYDPLYRFQQWQANLRILEVTEIKTVPYASLSHPFIEPLIGTIRCEYLDRTLFRTPADLETKLIAFQYYYDGRPVATGQVGDDSIPCNPISLELDEVQARHSRHGQAWVFSSLLGVT